MTSIIRTKKGAWFLGVCKGLEKSNRCNELFRLLSFCRILFHFWNTDFDLSWTRSNISERKS